MHVYLRAVCLFEPISLLWWLFLQIRIIRSAIIIPTSGDSDFKKISPEWLEIGYTAVHIYNLVSAMQANVGFEQYFDDFYLEHLLR